MLSEKKREQLFDEIRAKALCFCIAEATVEEIDRINILQATFLAMRRALAALAERPDKVLVDGNRMPPDLGCAGECIVGGDAVSYSIAAASILAKTHWDALMREYALEYPEYGFDSHFGYSTPEHFEALRRHGPCPIHRRSFAPVREALQPCLIDVL